MTRVPSILAKQASFSIRISVCMLLATALRKYRGQRRVSVCESKFNDTWMPHEYKIKGSEILPETTSKTKFPKSVKILDDLFMEKPREMENASTIVKRNLFRYRAKEAKWISTECHAVRNAFIKNSYANQLTSKVMQKGRRLMVGKDRYAFLCYLILHGRRVARIIIIIVNATKLGILFKFRPMGSFGYKQISCGRMHYSRMSRRLPELIHEYHFAWLSTFNN